MITPSPATMRNAHGCLEYAQIHGQALVLRGWIVDAAGPFDEVGVTAAGRALDNAQHIPRPDLKTAVTTIPETERSGFHLELPLELLDADGRVQIVLSGRRGGATVAGMRIGWMRTADDSPVPPAHLSQRVAHTELAYMFRAGGVKTAFDFHRAAARHAMGDPGRVLDWGCGPGRVTLHLARLYPEAEVIGSDLDHEALDWASEHLAGLRFVGGEPAPPLPLADASFDLITGGSVFTHLTRDLQDAWLAELRRLLAPGGRALVTTLGTFAAELRSTDVGLRERLARQGFDDSTLDPALDGVAPAGYYRATWQTPEWTHEHWSTVFDVLEHEEAGYENYQDLWVLGR